MLPPTFSGKYDKQQFAVFLEANLLLLGFLSLCTGLVLVFQVLFVCVGVDRVGGQAMGTRNGLPR